MFRRILARCRDWFAVDDPDDRIEGSGEAIVSPQHRRSLEAERMLEGTDEVDDPPDPGDRRPD